MLVYMAGQPIDQPIDQPQGQANWNMANLSPKRTGLPFVVYISQKGGARHDVRVKVSSSPKIRSDEIGSYSLRPFDHTDGNRLSTRNEVLLKEWIDINYEVLIKYWDGVIEYTEDVLEQLKPL